MIMTNKEITDIANAYAEENKSQYYLLQLLFVKPSQLLDGYWDVGFKVLNEVGNEIDGPLLVAVNDKTGQINSVEEVIRT